VRTTGEHRVRPVGGGAGPAPAGADRVEVTLALTMAGPLARLTALFGSRLIRRYLDLEADGLRREVGRYGTG
jgi:hypothetical protein